MLDAAKSDKLCGDRRTKFIEEFQELFDDAEELVKRWRRQSVEQVGWVQHEKSHGASKCAVEVNRISGIRLGFGSKIGARISVDGLSSAGQMSRAVFAELGPEAVRIAETGAVLLEAEHLVLEFHVGWECDVTVRIGCEETLGSDVVEEKVDSLNRLFSSTDEAEEECATDASVQVFECCALGHCGWIEERIVVEQDLAGYLEGATTTIAAEFDFASFRRFAIVESTHEVEEEDDVGDMVADTIKGWEVGRESNVGEKLIESSAACVQEFCDGVEVWQKLRRGWMAMAMFDDASDFGSLVDTEIHY